ncbi:hypothetical protein AB6A40_010627 [Gnathostoma spinigerum]|uniref:Cytochrome b5 n=1 Tax=Gnathostoma spinigerum TaxID=75299 RepID=A0ABD6EVF1_9BILA
MADVKKFTRAEVAAHGNTKSCWVIINNKVYDVTTFLDEHPGGCEVLLETGGLDATESFEDVGHSTDAREMREQYSIGDIIDREKQTYSFEKKEWDKLASANQESSILGNLVFPALIAVVLALLYYLFTV